jgi:hypothetical protein
MAASPTIDTATLGALGSRPMHRNEIARLVAQREGKPLADIRESVFASLSALKSRGWADNPQRGY